MNIFRKKKVEKIVEERKHDLEYLFETLSSELVEAEKQFDDICYQIEFFGATPELEQKKLDCELMLSWLQTQFDEIKKSLFQIQTNIMA